MLPVPPVDPAGRKGETDAASTPPCRVHNRRNCPMCPHPPVCSCSHCEVERARDAEARKQADCIGVTVPGVNAPQRFWTVSDHGGGGFWAVIINRARQYVGSISIRPWNTRAEAEADGRSSGLPEWRKP